MQKPWIARVFTVCTMLIAALGADDPVKDELAKHQGRWTVIGFRRNGTDTPEELARSMVRSVEGDHVVWTRDGKSFAGTKVELNPTKSPAWIDVIPDGGPSRGKRILGIYKLEGETLTICMTDPNLPRPTEFAAEIGSKQTLMRFEREKKQP